MFSIPPHLVPTQSVDDTLTGPRRSLSPPIAVIKVTRGVDPRTPRDPADTLNDASPYFSTCSEPPRTP
jgi:hypothetical protein